MSTVNKTIIASELKAGDTIRGFLKVNDDTPGSFYSFKVKSVERGQTYSKIIYIGFENFGEYKVVHELDKIDIVINN